MRLATPWLAAVCVTACAGGSLRPSLPPPGFAERIPADATVVARVDLEATQLAALVANLAGSTELLQRGKTCGLELPRLRDVMVAVARPFPRLVAEVHGPVTVQQLACTRGAQIPPDGRLTAFGATVSDLAGGVLITVGDPAGAAAAHDPTDLAAQFRSLAATGPIVLLAALGPRAHRYEITVVASATHLSRLRIRLASVEDARSFFAWLTDSLTRGRTNGFPALAALTPKLTGRDVELSITADANASAELAVALRAAVVEAFKIPAGSMTPSLLVGDHVFVVKGASGAPRRGDVIVFRYPPDPDKDFVKRVVAVAGDTVAVKGNVLVVNGRPVPRRELGPHPYQEYYEDTGMWQEHAAVRFEEELDGRRYLIQLTGDGGPGLHDYPEPGRPPYTVPAGTLFVLGDNRDNSHDSRYWGPVPLANVKGKVAMIWWSQGDAGIRWDRLGALVDEE